MENYDVIIAGASFAGLAVASQLQGKILLIDRFDIGTYQISACGTPYDVVKEIGCEDSVLQICDTFSFHVNGREVDCRLEKPYCTIDFARFCHQLNLQNKAEFLKASVLNVKKNRSFIVHTSKGEFHSDILVDATGYHAAMAEKLRPGYVHKDMMSFGIETEIPYQCDKFHFFYEPNFMKDGISWIFPCGEFSRFGVASYTGETKLGEKLDSFLKKYGLTRQKVHGGFFCYCFKDPVAEGIFVVGCAQGQTLPLTGEGIRRGLTYGRKCGEIIQKVLNKKMGLEDGLDEYSQLILRTKNSFDFLLKIQNRLLETPDKYIELGARIVLNRVIFNRLEKAYRKI